MAGFEETSIGLKAVYQKTFNETESKALPLATRIDSNDLSEKYAWLGNFPNMQKWVGDRDVQALTDYGYAITNELYESTITVPNIHLEYDKVGLYKPAIQQMAFEAKQFPSELIADLVVNGTTNTCYDGKMFFAADHEVDSTVIANMTTGELNSTNVLAAIMYMMSLTSENGKPLRINPNILVAGPQSLSKVMEVTGKQLTTGGESNVTYQIADHLILPEITGPEWFLFDTTRPIKPFIIQIAKDGLWEASNDHKFMKDAALFGAKSFMNAGYGLWQLAYRGSGEA